MSEDAKHKQIITEIHRFQEIIESMYEASAEHKRMIQELQKGLIEINKKLEPVYQIYTDASTMQKIVKGTFRFIFKWIIIPLATLLGTIISYKTLIHKL